MNPIISVESLYTLSRDQPIGIPILADVVYFLKRSPGLSGKELAKILNVKRSALSSAVHLLTGDTLNDLLRQWKLLKAMDLLSNTRLPYLDVAHLCGFKTVNGLSKFMERNHKCTAREYRENRVHGNRSAR